MRLRQRIESLLEQDEWEAVEALVAGERRAIRHLVTLSYRPDEALRRASGRALAIAARHHPAQVQEVVRRFVWAMNDESGTNALTAPAVIHAIALERPEILLPVVPDLVRLAGDPGLHEGLAEALREVARRCPGEVGERLGKSLNQRYMGSHT